MSTCDVCLNYDIGYVEFFYERERTARKDYKCSECSTPILRGQKYMRLGGKYEGQMWDAIVCSCCYEINTVFACGGPTEWGNMWEPMEEYIIPELTVSSPCFNKLSMASRAFLTQKWWEWKERQ